MLLQGAQGAIREMPLTYHSTSTDRSSVQPCRIKGAAPGEQFHFADPEVGKFLCLGHMGQNLQDLLGLDTLREGQGPRGKRQARARGVRQEAVGAQPLSQCSLGKGGSEGAALQYEDME